jgi:alpha-tubulin suppressor-like RCC1 family protein
VRRAGAVTAVLLAAGLALAACSGAAGPTATPTATAGVTTAVYRFGVVGNQGKIARLERATPTVVAGISGKVIQIATSNSDGYALTSAGPVWAWGVGSDGELGDGAASAYVTRAVRVSFPAGVRIVALPNPMPFDGGLAIDSAGHAWGWGLNADSDVPVRVTLPAGVLQVSQGGSGAGNGQTVAILADGTVWAWGGNQNGQLGTGGSTRTTPVDVGIRLAQVSSTASNVAGFEQS